MSDASAVYLPSEIHLSNLSEKHFVSFTKNRRKSLVYSEFGESFERKYFTAREYIAKIGDQNRDKFSGEMLKSEFHHIEEQLLDAFDVSDLPEIYPEASLLWRVRYLLRYYLDAGLFLI